MSCVFATLVAAVLPHSASAGIKCWTNGEGVRECGNAVPPEYSQKAHREMSETGVTVGTTKSNEELRKEREELARTEAIRAQTQRKINERKAKDRVLLSTFTTEEELSLAHADQVTAIDDRIAHTRKILGQLERSLKQLHAEAAKLERNGKTLTPEIERRIARVEGRMQDSHQFIEDRRLQKAALAAQFAEDRNRYRELKGIAKNPN